MVTSIAACILKAVAPSRHALVRFFSVVALCYGTMASAATPPVSLPGTLTLTNHGGLGTDLTAWDFTYIEPGWNTVVTGLIVKPSGTGPFPTVVLDHGKGGNAVGFGSQKSQEWFGPNGYMTISVELTHAGEVLCLDQASQCGGSPENVRRTETAVSIITSQALIDNIGDVVDRDNLFLYGNSLGATTALETAENLGSRFRAVALTAGGVILRSKLAYMTPSGSNGVADVGAPVMQMHGRLDDVVKPDEAQALFDALNLYDKVHQMVWFPNVGHNIATAQSTTTQVGTFILDWFDAYYFRTSPQLSTLSPASGKVGSGVKITGTFLGANTAGNSSLTFNGVKATPSGWKDTTITSKVPAGATTGGVQVTVPVGPVTDSQIEKPVAGGMRSNRLTFTVN